MTVPALPNTVLDPAVGVKVTSAWGDQLNTADAYALRDAPYAHVFNSGALSITNSVLLIATFDSERDDNNASHSTVSNTSRLTAVDPGVYDIGANASIQANATGIRQLLIRLNGATVIAEITLPNVGAASSTELAIATKYRLAAGDYIEMGVFQNSGGALNLQVGANWSPEFWFEWRRI